MCDSGESVSSRRKRVWGVIELRSARYEDRPRRGRTCFTRGSMELDKSNDCASKKQVLIPNCTESIVVSRHKE